ncbi:hypothetical protein BJ508DRAFT_381654 [Ascobolus immersus RN42]|uniref:Uncharacterized protein n=1 Tax=Ascobolus immersus RN42 TaxID=1160509 RepID=A0A3N4HRH1_ASCIM|nr:hypothetical protein BJ508DRAFT_381654 [Ascobolus immersus RN42]
MRVFAPAWVALALTTAVCGAVLSSPTPDSAAPTATPTGNVPPVTSADVELASATNDQRLRPPPGNGKGCADAFTTKDTIINFDNLRQYCFRVCPDFVTQSLTFDRGSGWAEVRETTQPILFPNADGWSVLNCSAVPSKPEGQACGPDPPGYAKALLSNGTSLFDSNRAPRFGTVEYAKDFLLFDLKSLYVTPIVMDITLYTNVKVHIKGLAKDGRVVSHTATVLANFRHLVTVPSTFTKLSALDIWIEKPGSTTKYPFAIDDISILEYVPVAKPWSCYATSTYSAGPKGPCTPKPTATKTWTINFDSFPTQTQIPTYYEGVTWGQYLQVSNSSTNPLMYMPPFNTPEPYGPPSPPSQRNYLTNSGQTIVLLSSSLDDRFGIKEVSVLCRFPVWVDGDTYGTNGKPCLVTFVGRRDKYDGAGLPVQVEATYSIPNPNITDGRVRTFTKIKLDQLTKQPGGFSRLFRLEIFTNIIGKDYNQYVESAYDNFVLTRPLGEGTKCRIPGVKTLDFDDLKSNSPIPLNYNGFKFAPQGWSGVELVASYPAGVPKTSRPNAARTDSDYQRTIDSFLDANPANRKLFDFEALTITANVVDQARVNALRFTFSAADACGSEQYRGADWFYGNYSSIGNYYDSIQSPRGVQFKFARPFYASSLLRLTLYYDYDSPYSGEQVSFWVDDIKYRPNKTPIPPCKRCGYRGAGLCEVPRIIR